MPLDKQPNSFRWKSSWKLRPVKISQVEYLQTGGSRRKKLLEITL